MRKKKTNCILESVNTHSDNDSWNVSTDIKKCVCRYADDRVTWTAKVIFNEVMHLYSACLFTVFMPADANCHQATDSWQINILNVM